MARISVRERRSRRGPFHLDAVPHAAHLRAPEVPGGGVEPPLRASKALVLPLDDPGPGPIIPRRGRPQTEHSQPRAQLTSRSALRHTAASLEIESGAGVKRAVRHRLTKSRDRRFRSVAYSPCGSGSSSSETELMQ